MANSLNQCNFIGHLGADPESRQAGASTVCNFSIAVSSSWTDKSGQKQERTEWVRVVAWGKLGGICQEYLHKGNQCFISGEMRTDKYQDKKTGEDRYSTSIVASNMQLLGGRGDAPLKPTTGPDAVGGNPAGPNFDDQIPF